jgi:hypothetical protein
MICREVWARKCKRGHSTFLACIHETKKETELKAPREIKEARTYNRVLRPFLTLAESSCIVIQRMPNKAFNTDGEYAAG